MAHTVSVHTVRYYYVPGDSILLERSVSMFEPFMNDLLILPSTTSVQYM